jgi:hypothetical protein
MKVATSDKGTPPRNGIHSEQGIKNGRSRGAPGYVGRERAYVDQTLRLIIDLLAGLFALWISLTVVGLIGLSDIGNRVSSLSLRVIVASGLALMICIISSPLFVPWFAVFVAAYLLLPRKSFVWKWWLCTIVGSLVGIAALWIDALVGSLLTPRPSISLNFPLLISASNTRGGSRREHLLSRSDI